MNQLIRDAIARRRRQPERDEQGRFLTSDPGHDDARVGALIRARAEAEAIGDQGFATELDRKIRSVAPEYARPIQSADGGRRARPAGIPRQLDPNQAMNAWMRGSLRRNRERLAELVDEELDR
jgi:hypothetical protein